jgi:hypothetical protein
MTLEERLSAALQAVAEEFIAAYALMGTLGSLTTVEKNSLVLAINELNTAAELSNFIVDPSGDIQALKDELLGGASTDYDTLQELMTAINTNQNGLTTILASLSNRVRFDAVQTLDATQKLTANTNIASASVVAMGNLDTDFAGIFNTATAGLFVPA